MRRLLLFISILLLPYWGFSQLVVNEVSQGPSGNEEYIELVVVGTRTCNDSTADLRNWIIDDQNGWFSTVSISQGHLRFANIANWANVPYGSIILLYNNANKNPSITLPDDPTDANKDNVYVVPVNSSTYIEEYTASPTNASTPAYTYPTSGTAYTNPSGAAAWLNRLALNNAGDVISIVKPNAATGPSSAYFSLMYGTTPSAGYYTPTLVLGAIGASQNAYLTDSTYANASHWAIGTVSTNETPGSPNGSVNTSWINSMRVTGATKAKFSVSPASACIGKTFSFTDLSIFSVCGDRYSAVWDYAGGSTTAIKTGPGAPYVTPSNQTIVGSAITQSFAGSIRQLNATSGNWPIGRGNADNNYIEYTIQPVAGKTLTVDSIMWRDSHAGGSGNTTISVEYALNGNSFISVGTSTITTINTTPGAAFHTIAVSPINVGAGDVLKVRLYIYSPSGSNTRTVYIDDLTLKGSTNTFTTNGYYLWDFGDGSTSTTQNPTHSYSAAGIYSVKLKAYNDCGCLDSIVIKDTVIAPPIPSFTVNNQIQCKTGNSFTFTNTTAGSNTYSWNFGDGGTATGSPVTHSYSASGSYTVKLYATNSSGCADSTTMNITVNAPPVPDFTINATPQCFNANNFTFTNTSVINSCTNTVVATWPLTAANQSPTVTGNGASNVTATAITLGSSLTNISYNGTQGLHFRSASTWPTTFSTSSNYYVDFPIKPIAGYNLNISSYSFTGEISAANDTTVFQWAYVLNGNTPVALGSPIKLSTLGASTVYPPSTAGITVPNGQTFVLRLYIYAAGSVSNSRNVYIKDVVINATTQSPATGTYQWNFGDGATSTATTPPVHNYTNPGTYTVTLTATNGCGCSDSVKKTVTVLPTPSAPTAPSPQTFCASANPTIANLTATGTNLQWYAASSGGTALASSTALVNGATYYVSQDSAGCTSGRTPTTVILNASVTPSVSITPTTVTSCTGSSVTFTATPVNGGLAPTYQWYVNGVPVSGATSSTFTSSTLNNGDIVKVVMTSNAVCTATPTATSNSVTVTITGNAAPAVSITPTNVTACVGSSITFTASPVNGGSNPTYQWYVNGNPVPGATGSTFTSSTFNNGDVVKVVMTSNAACASTPTATSNSVTITLNPIPPAPVLSVSDTCGGSRITASGVTGTLTWSDGGTGNPRIVTTGGAFSVTQTVNGCISALSNAVTAAPFTFPVAPTVSVTAQPTCTVATGTISVTAPTGAGLTYSIDGVTYTNTSGIFANAAPGTYNVTVRNGNGCTSPATSVTVNPQPPTPAAPVVTVTQSNCNVATGTISITAPTGTGLTYSVYGIDYTNTSGVFTGLNPGTYSVTVKNSSGCISLVTSVTINPQPPTPAAPTITVTQSTCTITTGTITITSPTGSGLTYSIDGVDYTNTSGIFTNVVPGTYKVTVQNASGCTSTATSATINAPPAPPTKDTTSYFACTSYVYKGITYTSSTIITDTIKSVLGCDSIYHFNNIVIQNITPVTNTISKTGCDSVLVNGIKYTASTVLSDTLRTALGCDSVYNVTNIIVNHATVKDTSACILQGGSFTISGQPFTIAGNYSIKTTNTQGCDSIITLHLNVTKIQTLDTAGCDSVRYNGITYTGNTSFVQTIPSQTSSCDSIKRTVNITIKKKSSSNTNICIGPAQTYTFNGQTYNATGHYTATLINAQGCDSIANLYLVKSSVDTAILAGCDSVSFNNKWYYSATTVKDTVKSVVTTCDSLIHVHSIVINKSKTTNVSDCEPVGGSYTFFGQTLTVSGSYTHTIPTSSGCDSVIRLQLLIAQIQAQDDKGCDSVIFKGITYHTSTTVSDTLHGQSGCDSIIHQHNIIVTPVPQTSISNCIGIGQSYNFNGQTLTTSGNYTTTYQRPGLCDSIVHLKLLVAQTQTITYQGCSHYVYNSIDYTSSTTLHDTLKSNAGCDSLVRTINILITPSIQVSITGCIKQGQSYPFHNQNLTVGGYYTDSLKAKDGCDSIVKLYLVVAVTQTQNLAGCDSVQLNGITYYASTQVTDTTRSLISGCDSLYKVSVITVKKTQVQNVSVCLQQGQTYNLNGQVLTVSGQYTTRFTRPGDCDSIVHLTLVIPVTQSQTLNGCDSVSYKGIMYYASTTAKDTVKSIGNCDSIYHLTNIVVKASPKTSTTACIKQGQSYSFNGQTLTTGGYYTTTYQTSSCDSTVKLYLTVAQTQTQTVKGCDSVLFKGKVYYSSTAVNDTTRSVISNCDSIVATTNIVINPVKQQYITACVAPGQSYNFNGQILSTTGNYQTTYTGSQCDSIVHLYLVATKKDTIILQGCSSVVYNNVTYTSSTILQNNIASSVTGCDSIQRTIRIVVNSVISTNTTACIKQGQSYLFNGQNLATTGYYTATYTAQAGCDSTVKLYLTVSSTQNQTLNGCDSLRYKGITYFASTQVTDTVKSVVSNCDSLYNIANIVIKASPVNSINVCLGAGQTYNFNGQVLTASGNYTTIYTRPGNCDSTVKLKLVIAVVDAQNINGCDSVVYKGVKYFATTVLRDTVYAVQGSCDSIYHVINITIKPSPNSFTTACIVQGQSYNFNGQNLTSGGYYTTTYQTATCDSTVKLYLTVTQKTTQTLNGCDSIKFRGATYYVATSINDTLHSAISGCDSVINTTVLSILPAPHTFINACLAQGQTYNFNGQQLTATGHYQTVYTTSRCDSTVHLYLIAAKKDTIKLQGCNSVSYKGITYTASTTLSDTVHSSTGCDSLISVTDVVVNPVKHQFITACVASGQSYNFNGQILTATGHYQTTYTGNPCDSVVHLYLVATKKDTLLLQGCNSVTYNGTTYSASTTLQNTIPSSVTGCDSIQRTIQILITSTIFINTNACIKQGQSYLFNGQNLTATGYYTAAFTAQGGCDSTVRLYLSVAQTQAQTLNGCDSISFRGNVYYTSTQITDTVKSIVSGCDSLYNVNQLVIQPSAVTNTSLCLGVGQTYNFNGQTLTTSGNYVATYPRTGQCDSTVKLKLVIATLASQTLTGCDSLVYKGITYTASTSLQDTVHALQGSCDSIYHVVNIVIKPSPKTFTTACIKQGQSYNFNGQLLNSGGYYTTTYQTSSCDSTVRLYLTVAQTQSQTVQGCDSVIYKGKAYYASTTISDTTRSMVSGCDSLITSTDIVVNSAKHQYITACAAPGQTYNFNGQILTATGAYQTTYAGSKCDSIVHLYLVVTKKDTLALQGCSSVTYNGITYTSSTNLPTTIPSSITGCDSLQRTVQIIISNAININTNACINQGQSYLFNGQNLTATGYYTATFTAQAGCDSAVRLYLSVSSTQAQTLNGCDSIRFRGITYFASTQVADTVKSIVSGCDSLYTTYNLHVNKSVVSNSNLCLAEGQTYSFNGQTLTLSGNYTTTYQRPGSCDSVVHLNLVIAKSESQTINGCDSVVYKGVKYFTSVVLRDTVRSTTGCDSIYSLTNINIKSSPNSFTTACIAPGQSYLFNGQQLTTSGNYITTYTRPQQCDSIVHLYLLVAQKKTQTLQGCNSVVYNGITYTASTTLMDTIHSASGCDSILQTINIVIAQTLQTNINACIKQGQSYSFNGQNLTTGGNYTAQFTTQGGCDSLVHLYLTVSNLQTQSINGCDSVRFGNIVYHTSTQITDTVKSIISGCDSLYKITNLVVKSSPVSAVDVCLSEGQTYTFNGQVLTSSGNYTTLYQRPGDCDSVVKLKLVIAAVDSQTINSCGPVTYNNSIYTSSTTVKDTVRSTTNCDSVYRVVNIVIGQSLQTFTTACIKQGQSYNFNGQVLTTNGYYTTTYQTPKCDSTVRLYLTVAQTQTQTLQGCDSVLYKGNVYYTSSSVSDTVHSAVSNCDSLITAVTITINPVKHQFITACIAPGQSYNFNGQVVTTTGNYSTTYARPGLCDSIVHLYLVATRKDSVTLQGCTSVVYNGVTYTSSTNINNTIPSSVTGCDSIIRTIQILITPTINTNTTACIKQGHTYLFNGQPLSTTGNYTAQFTAQAGCDSVVHLYLLVATSQSQTISGCDSVLYKGIIYRNSTTVSDTVKSIITSCDSLYNITNLVINKGSASYQTACLAAGQTYNFNGQQLTQTGSYKSTLTNAAGCDSTANLYLVVSTTQSQTVQGCSPFVYNGITYTSSTTLRDTVKSVITSCDSLYRSTIINITTSKEVFTTGCIHQGQAYAFGNLILTVSGNYTNVFTTSTCDSIVHLNLIVSRTDSQTVAGCGSVVYNNITYTTSTLLKDTLHSQSGCDSIYKVVQITVNSAPVITKQACINSGQTYSFNGQTLTATGWYTATYQASGCDSTVNLYLTVSNNSTQQLSGCGSVVLNGTTYTASTVVKDTVKSVVSGCDSLYRTINIIITKKDTTTVNACLQLGQTYSFNGQTLATSGFYSTTFNRQGGCDSTVLLYLVAPRADSITQRGCGSVLYNGITYTSSTVLRDTLRSVRQCDSVYKFTFIQVDTMAINFANVCLQQGQSYNLNGQQITTGGYYSATIKRQGQCDSVSNIYATFSSAQSNTIQGCGSVVYQNNVYTNSTVLRDTVKSSVSGCDSIYHITNIVVKPLPVTNTSQCVKEGQNYNFNGQVLTTTGNYTTVYTRSGQCDSTVHLYLLVSQTKTEQLSGCGSVVYNGFTYTSSTTVDDTIRSVVTSCDSLYHTVQIIVYPIPQTYTTACLSEGGTYNFNGQQLIATGNYTATYQRLGQCDSIAHLYLVVSKTQKQTVAGCGSVVYNGITYATSTVLKDTVRSQVTQCDSVINLVTIKINPKPAITVTNDTTICKGTTALLTAYAPASNITWTGIGTGNSINVSPFTTTTYIATAIDTNGCTNRASLKVAVQEFSLTLSTGIGPLLAGSSTTVLSSANLAYNMLAWQPSSLFRNQTAKTQKFFADTTINVIAIAQSSLGCLDTASVLIEVTPLDDIYIPNAFTPNGDGKNDVFRVRGSNIKEFDFKIFNRWGELVFATTEKNKGWDGTYTGKPQPIDTYVYVVRATMTNGQVITKKGAVTLIR